MILALTVAIVLGIALGWIIHRSTHNHVQQQFKNRLTKQNALLVQAQSDVSMLSDDYDELRLQAQDEIKALRADNQQIPTLTTNLEKSQLLVQQMIKRHEARVRDLNNENQRLVDKIEELQRSAQRKIQDTAELGNPEKQDRSDSLTSQHDELEMPTRSDSEATESADLQRPRQPDDSEATELADLQRPQRPDDSEATEPAGLQRPRRPDSTAAELDNLERPRPGDGQATTPYHRQNLEADSQSQSEPESSKVPDASEPALSDSKPAIYAAAESDDDPFDEVMEVTGDLQLELEDNNTDILNDDLRQRAGSSTPSSVHFDSTETSGVEDSADNFSFETGTSSDDNAFDMLDDDSVPSFDPVGQKDDLQQIFGIGPLTEKALNDLGITSYSQLADLKQHDIQRIADALDIGASRIERDNWVGNARRQLEEVLEQL